MSTTCLSARARVCILGDSTVVNHYKYIILTKYCWITNLAVSGDTFLLSENRWLALSLEARQAFDFVFFQLGINGVMDGQVAEMQHMIDTINLTKRSDCKLIALTHTPTTNDWETTEVNKSIMGTNLVNITGVFAEYHQHSAEMADVDGTLLPLYDSGDSTHPNLAGNIRNSEIVAGYIILNV